MPTYRNDTQKRITHQDANTLEWQPGEEKRLPFFVPWKDLGLTLVSAEPHVLKNTSVRDYTEFELRPGAVFVYDIPYHEAFELSLSALSGAAAVTVGDGDVRTVIDTRHDHVSTYSWKLSAYLTFEALGDTAAQIIVKVEERTWKESNRGGVE